MGNIDFNGTIYHNMDAKGRVTIPTAFRKQLGEDFTIAMNEKFNAVVLYPKEHWEEISARLRRIPDTDALGIAYVRITKAFSMPEQNLDAQGRILLPTAMRKRAGLDKEICFVGVGSRLEIWSDVGFDKYIEDEIPRYIDLSKHVNDTYSNVAYGGDKNE
ncbi:MAG: division/cell wall cluster transcriptional repressor MraZ [Clostridia bacterium]|nr:division/cell wall cluster transcriptional repressor MraZ [Clostridia bacterium]